MYPRAYIYFTLALAISVAGFFPSYFGRLGDTDLKHHFHGITATLWFLMLIGQSWFISRKKIDLHRKIGKASYVLAPLLVIGGLLMMQSMMAADGRMPFQFRLTLLFLDAVSILLLVFMYTMAIANRKNTQIHARCMTATVFAILGPSLFRFMRIYVPGFENPGITLMANFFIIELIILALLIHDWRNGGLRYPYVVVMGLTIFKHVMMRPIQEIGWWQSFGHWVANWSV